MTELVNYTSVLLYWCQVPSPVIGTVALTCSHCSARCCLSSLVLLRLGAVECGFGRQRLVLHLTQTTKSEVGCFTRLYKEENGINVFSKLKEADKVFPLFNFFLYFVTGGGDFCLCREDGTDEGEDCSADGSVKGPAQGAVSRFVGRRIVSTVGNGLLTAPASRVEYQTENKEQACKGRREKQ